MTKKVSSKSFLIIFSVFLGTVLGVFFYKYEKKNQVVYESHDIEVVQTVFDGKPKEYTLYKEEELNGAVPELYQNLIPVSYLNGAWVKANVYEKWYSYKEFNWANAVVVKDEKKDYYENSESGININKEDILGFFVWIPRFEYKLFNVDFKPVNEQQIEVKFVSSDTKKETVINNGLFYTHPAFSVNVDGQEKELNGFWIAKFEPTKEDGIIKILPNKETLVSLNMAQMWAYATGITDSYGLNVTSRIITNMEYGAMAALSYSQYGKRNNTNYQGNERLIFLNTAMGNANWDKVVTGCSAGTAINGGTYRCPYSYDYPYYGTGASSTGTIYGIYDLAGGSWECVMGIVSDYPIKDNLGGYNGALPHNRRYYTFYSASDMYDYSRSQVGDMMGEVVSNKIKNKTWNGNNAYFATSSYPWVKRGGSFRGGSYSGIFDFGITDAITRGDKTFRVILSLY